MSDWSHLTALGNHTRRNLHEDALAVDFHQGSGPTQLLRRVTHGANTL